MIGVEPDPFATLLRRYRRAAGLTQEELAERAHLSTRAISALEQGENHAPRKDTVALLAEALALTPEARDLFIAAARAAGDHGRPIPMVRHNPAAPAHPNNLPLALTGFIGREEQRAIARRLLGQSQAAGGYRLLTITGAGGAGKTRMALQLAGDMLAEYPDGVWLVELAPLGDPALVPQAVASAVGAREEPGRPLLATLIDLLRSRHLLLVLDNCEHLVTACAEVVPALLSACPHLRVLATSREPLRSSGEVTWQVPALTAPDPRHLPPVDEFIRYEAVQLFVERAQAASPAFAVLSEDVPAIAQICHRLDGMPLAIELAAARIRVLSVPQIAARLEDCFRLLTAGTRTGLSRHRTLKATMDWSYELLSSPEQVLLGRLAVFAGGFSLEAAETVCGGVGLDEPRILDLLSGLLDKSLILRERQRGAARYRLLEPIRQYAAQVLARSGDLTSVRRQHHDWCLRLAEGAEAQLWTAEQRDWLARLETEHDNLRAALDWCTTAEGEAESGLRLARALWQFWLLRGYFSDGRHWLESLLTVAPIRTPLRAGALVHACALAARQNLDEAAAMAEQAIVAYSELDDPRGCVQAMHIRGMVAWLQFDYPRACKLFEQARVVADGAGLSAEAALLTHSLGVIRWWQGDYKGARVFMEASLRQTRILDDEPRVTSCFLNLGSMPMDDQAVGPTEMGTENSILLLREIGVRAVVGHILANLGSVARCEREYERAELLLEESRRVFRGIGDDFGIAQVIGQVGNLARVRGDYARARLLLEECLTLRQEIGESRGIGHALFNLGRLALAEGDQTQARALVEEGVAIMRAIHDKPATAWETLSLGYLALREGDYARARAVYTELVELYDAYGADRHGRALSLAGLGIVSKHEHDNARARASLEASLTLWRQVGDRRSGAALLQHLGEVAQGMGDSPSAAAYFAESLSHYQELDDPPGIARVQAAMARAASGDATVPSALWTSC
jgi:predicted ATPase/transcriptional regulator with XRE-family HTH domain